MKNSKIFSCCAFVFKRKFDGVYTPLEKLGWVSVIESPDGFKHAIHCWISYCSNFPSLYVLYSVYPPKTIDED